MRISFTSFVYSYISLIWPYHFMVKAQYMKQNFFRQKLVVSRLVTHSHFIGPRFYKRAVPYLKPYDSSPYPSNHCLEIHSNIIIPSTSIIPMLYFISRVFYLNFMSISYLLQAHYTTLDFEFDYHNNI